MADKDELIALVAPRVRATAARAANVRVTNTPSVLTDTAAELTIGLMIAMACRIPQTDQHVRAGKWPTAGMGLFFELTGKTVGILDLGRIGKEIAGRTQAMKMRVVYYDRKRQPAEPHIFYDNPVDMARDIDWLVIIAPGGKGTEGIVSRQALEALDPKGNIVNVARGSLIDEAAMLELLQTGSLGGAALDVFEREPAAPEAFFSRQCRAFAPPWQRHHSGTQRHGRPGRRQSGRPFCRRTAHQRGGVIMLILHGGKRSSFVRRVAIWLGLQGREFERRPVDLFGADFESFRARNPLSRVPALSTPDDDLIETSTIIDYLETTALPARRLLPASGPERIACLQRIALANAIAEKGVAYVYEIERRPSELVRSDWADRLASQVEQGLHALEARADRRLVWWRPPRWHRRSGCRHHLFSRPCQRLG
ncbi:MAG: glutathione S-transferase N-terminal domain-containing protein [Candidatus Devosia euplotis]|nr:glutathione S-transferase N-terminal domain-containing protein [Candidatus Devosia euplotis]